MFFAFPIYYDVLRQIIIRHRKVTHMKKIVLYGDSNTFGYDPRGILDRRYPAKDRWPDLLAQNPDWDIRAYGLNGRMIPRYNADFAYLDQILMNTAPFDLLCIMLGSNDLLCMMEPDIREVADQMEKLLTYLMGRSAIQQDAGRILLLAPPPFQIRDPYSAGHTRESLLFADAYRKVAGTFQTHFADTGSWDIGISYDGVHFTEEGNHTFAIRMNELFCSLFNPTSGETL